MIQLGQAHVRLRSADTAREIERSGLLDRDRTTELLEGVLCRPFQIILLCTAPLPERLSTKSPRATFADRSHRENASCWTD